jgi:hypothetical protein
LPNPICKCCGRSTSFFAQYDFSRTCEDYKAPVFAKSNTDIPYYRWSSCGFVFTSYFDSWSGKDMAERIYNSDYVLADPEFTATRPEYIASDLDKMLAPVRGTIDILDYGGGKGRLIEELGKRGFKKSRFFDPFFFSGDKPDGQFDLVTAFEVVEHAAEPLSSIQDALSYMTTDGALLFTTALQDRKVDRDWWYIAPRNGHISIHSYASLQCIAAAAGARCLSLGDNLHLLYRNSGSSVARQIAGDQRGAALYAASRRGLGSFIRTTGQFDELGFARQSTDVRHLCRATLVSSGFA